MSSSPSQSGTLTLLGTGTSMGVPVIGCDCPVCTSTNPRNQRTRTGVAVTTPQGMFLIDTPPELRLQLIRERVSRIEAVLYTHAHADHLMGLDDLRIFAYQRKAPVDLYCEANVEATIRQTFSYAFSPDPGLHSRPELKFHTIGPEPFELLGTTIHPVRLMHGHLPVLGYRLGNVAFCTDCKTIPDETWDALQGLDTLVLDALWEEPHPTHFSISEALDAIERLQPRRAYLTHISHRLDYDKTNARLPSGVELSYDGLQIPWSDESRGTGQEARVQGEEKGA